MADLLGTVLRTAILDDSAFQAWQERPNVFLRGIVLLIIVSLVAGLAVFAVNLVAGVTPVDVVGIEEGIQQSFDWQYRFNPGFQDPEVQEMMERTFDVIVPMVSELSDIDAPLPKGIAGFFKAFGGWLSRALTAIGGWMLYGSLVLIFVNLLGGSAKLGEFLGTVAVYVVPGLLGLLSPLPCVGPLLVFIAMVWSIVVYIKATSVVGKLDAGRAILAVVAPFFCAFFLGIILMALLFLWLAIVF